MTRKFGTIPSDEAGWPASAPTGGSTPSGTGWTHITAGVQDAAASTPTAADVGAATSAQGGKADSAVQPNTTPTLTDVTITALSGGIISGTSTKQDLIDLDDSAAQLKFCGFGAWTSGADAATYTITGGKFQIDRDGYGYIFGKKYAWTGGVQTGVLSANNTHYIYWDTDAALKSSTSFVANKIMLFEALYDGTNYDVVKENHPYSFPTSVSGYAHSAIGTIIFKTGANVTRVATGTGAATGDRQVKIVGADTLSDHGLSTTIPDSAGAGVTWQTYYRNAGGKWTRYASNIELQMFYNAAGTPTALDATPHTFAVTVLFCSKDDIETGLPLYVAVMDEQVYATLILAQQAIANGTPIFPTNELNALELAQLGYAIIQYSATGGYIEELVIAKSTLNSQLVGGGAGTATDHALLTHLDYASSGHTGFLATPAPITPGTNTKITYDLNGLVTSGAAATTADIADSADKRYCTDAQKTVIGNTSGTNSGNQTTIVGITGTIAQFNTACTDADFATGGGTATGSNTGDQTLPVKAIGSEINTGTDDAKFVTAKALHDSAAVTGYRTLLDSSGSHTAAKVAGTYGLGQGDPAAVTGVGTLYPLNTIAIAAADYPTVNGLAPKLRVRFNINDNDVAPFTGTFVCGLHPVTRPATSGGLGLCIYTIGTAATGSTVTLTNPAADAANLLVGADFALPSDGQYVLAFVTNATMATSAHCHISASLQIHNA